MSIHTKESATNASDRTTPTPVMNFVTEKIELTPTNSPAPGHPSHDIVTTKAPPRQLRLHNDPTRHVKHITSKELWPNVGMWHFQSNYYYQLTGTMCIYLSQMSHVLLDSPSMTTTEK